MRSHTAWGLLPEHTTHTAQVGAARASLELRAGQSIASKWVIWAVCVATVFTLPDELPLWMRLCWAVPVMLMAEVNWRVCTQVMANLGQADAAVGGARAQAGDERVFHGLAEGQGLGQRLFCRRHDAV